MKGLPIGVHCCHQSRVEVRVGATIEVDVAQVLVTDQLYRRSARMADLQAELTAYRELSEIMATDPELAIERFLQLALELCPAAGSAGLSELDSEGDAEIFRWTAMSGAFTPYVGGTTPRDFSPCGLCLDRHHTILLESPARLFTYFNEAEPAICEGLIVPLYDTGKQAIGTLWIVSHREDANFDPTDARVMEQLAVQLVLAIKLRRKLRLHEALQEAVEDRELLVGEVRHRVKNMIQMTTSLLRMQESSTKSRQAKEALHEATDRLTVLANVYEALLGPAPHSRTLNAGDLVRKLVPALLGTKRESAGISVDLDCEDIELRVEQATSVGLIVNEAVTNALKYAFSPKKGGVIRVRLVREGGVVKLVVSDDGRGFEAPPRERSMGIRMMRAFARQLEGEVSIDGSRGTTVTLTWPAQVRTAVPA